MRASVVRNFLLVIISALCVSQTKSAPPLVVVSLNQSHGQSVSESQDPGQSSSEVQTQRQSVTESQAETQTQTEAPIQKLPEIREALKEDEEVGAMPLKMILRDSIGHGGRQIVQQQQPDEIESIAISRLQHGGRKIVQQQQPDETENAISRLQHGAAVQFVQPRQYTIYKNKNNGEVDYVEQDGQGQGRGQDQGEREYQGQGQSQNHGQSNDFFGKLMNIFSFGRLQKNFFNLDFLPMQSFGVGQKVSQGAHDPERRESQGQGLPFCENSGAIPFFGSFMGFWCSFTDNIFFPDKQGSKRVF